MLTSLHVEVFSNCYLRNNGLVGAADAAGKPPAAWTNVNSTRGGIRAAAAG